MACHDLLSASFFRVFLKMTGCLLAPTLSKGEGEFSLLTTYRLGVSLHSLITARDLGVCDQMLGNSGSPEAMISKENCSLTDCFPSQQCSIEWFHFACVGLTTKPRGKW